MRCAPRASEWRSSRTGCDRRPARARHGAAWRATTRSSLRVSAPRSTPSSSVVVPQRFSPLRRASANQTQRRQMTRSPTASWRLRTSPPARAQWPRRHPQRPRATGGKAGCAAQARRRCCCCLADTSSYANPASPGRTLQAEGCSGSRRSRHRNCEKFTTPPTLLVSPPTSSHGISNSPSGIPAQGVDVAKDGGREQKEAAGSSGGGAHVCAFGGGNCVPRFGELRELPKIYKVVYETLLQVILNLISLY